MPTNGISEGVGNHKFKLSLIDLENYIFFVNICDWICENPT